MRRHNSGVFCIALGVGLLIAVLCPIEVMLVLAAVVLVLFGVSVSRK